MKLTLLAVLSGLWWVTDGARILMFLPFPARSHQNVFRPLMRGLAERGHSVTAYTPIKLDNPPPNYEEIIIPDLLHDMHKNLDMNNFGMNSPLMQGIVIYETGISLQTKVCELQEVRELIHSDLKFDLVILESVFFQESFSAFQHKFKAPAVDIASHGHHAWINFMTGTPYNPSYVLDFKSPYTDRMSFAERLGNSVVALGTIAAGYFYYLPKYQAIMDACFNYEGWESRPPLERLIMDKSLVLSNSHFTLNFPFPLSPNLVEVGGINIEPSKPLPQDLQKWLDEAERGFIYFSLGSNLNLNATDTRLRAFVSAFGKLALPVFWKLDTTVAEMPDNVRTSKWYPQNDVLNHRNCLLFITHGGFLSLAESVSAGVPVLAIPFFGDQPKNVRHVTATGYGLRLDQDNITEQSVSWAINEVLSNPSYRAAASERSAMFHDKPSTALETAVYWVEYVIRNKGAPELRPAILELRWWQVLLLDVAIALFLPSIILIALLYFAIGKIIGRFCPKKGAKTEKTNKCKVN